MLPRQIHEQAKHEVVEGTVILQNTRTLSSCLGTLTRGVQQNMNENIAVSAVFLSLALLIEYKKRSVLLFP